MEINKKTRTELKQYFKINDKPTQQEFADFIEAGINQKEDGIAKIEGNPLAIQAEGENGGTQEVLDIFTNLSDDNPQWSFNLNPRVDPQEPSSNQPGFNIKDTTGQSRLFIKSDKGNIGVGTIEPESKLTIEGKNVSSLLSVIDTTQKHTKIFEITQKEGVTIKGALTIDGDFSSNNISDSPYLDNEGASNNKIPTQKAVKTYVDTRLPKGMISMWSGKDIPVGWVLCDGTNNTPNLSGKFIVGQDKSSGDYNEIGNTGGLEQVTLTTKQIPSHHHSGNTASSGNHHHNISHPVSKNSSGDSKKTITVDGENHGTLTFKTQNGGAHSHSFKTKETGGDQPHENRPPYYVLAYIMKL